MVNNTSGVWWNCGSLSSRRRSIGYLQERGARWANGVTEIAELEAIVLQQLKKKVRYMEEFIYDGFSVG